MRAENEIKIKIHAHISFPTLIESCIYFALGFLMLQKAEQFAEEICKLFYSPWPRT